MTQTIKHNKALQLTSNRPLRSVLRSIELKCNNYTSKCLVSVDYLSIVCDSSNR
jgi:hypothetical protein